ncbi:MAG: hypothetical protein NTY98_22480 [Verrucomicrobia bacterium]|nr:hypothetical protein [Verrucomicrobiota bacterium]
MSDPQRSSIPDTLFKYVNAEGGLATLKDATVSVMFSKPSDLNDPFEFLPSLDGLSCDPAALTLDCRHLVSPLLSANADYLRQEVELHWFVTSLTSADRNVRMWAQYAMNHTGIKFTFNLAELAIHKDMIVWVDYSQPYRTDIRGLIEPNATKDDKGIVFERLGRWKNESVHEVAALMYQTGNSWLPQSSLVTSIRFGIAQNASCHLGNRKIKAKSQVVSIR